MTREEKVGFAKINCVNCQTCPAEGLAQAHFGVKFCDFDELNESVLDEYVAAFEAAEKKKTPAPDNVNHPQHYELPGGIECIDVLLATQGKEDVMAFCLCNAIKYLYRHKRKNGIEDIKKARWYINKYLELEGRSDAQARE